MARFKRSKDKIDPSRMHPSVAAGLTVDVPVGEALKMNPPMPVRSGVEVVKDFNAASKIAAGNTRDSSVHFVAMQSGDNEIVIEDPNTGRKMSDADVALPEGHISQIKAGYRCIQCYEYWGGEHLPLECPVCHYPSRQGQPMRALHEFDEERNIHIGPRKPLREIIEEREIKKAQKDFLTKLRAGKSPMRGLIHRGTR